MKANHPLTCYWHSAKVRRLRRSVSPRLWYRYLTGAWRALPDVIIAGAMKAGTTSLYGYLEGHPQMGAPLTKEVNFFDKYWHRGELRYRMNFPFARRLHAQGRRTFEASPYYMCEPRVPERMAAMLPAVKLIFLIRNPVSRAYSHYQHSVLRRREPLSFEDALQAESERLEGERDRMLADPLYNSYAYQHYSYLERGLYAEQLRHWRKYFSADQMLVIEAERMFRQPAEVFTEVLEFAGLEPWLPASFENLNSGRYKQPMSQVTKARLEAYFAPHNRQLYDLLGWETSWDQRKAA